MTDQHILVLKEVNAEQISKSNTAHACSDGTIYFDGDEEAIEKHAKKHGLSVAYLKPVKETKYFTKKTVNNESE